MTRKPIRLSSAFCLWFLIGGPLAGPSLADEIPQPVKIGVLTDMAGMYKDIMGPGSVLAAQMAVDDFGGKVLGRPIEIVSGDHQTKPDVGAAIARNWFDNNGIGVVVDVAQSAVALAVQEVARSRSMIVMHGVTGTPAITQEACTPTTFSWSLNAYAISAPLPRPLIEKGLDTFFFLAADYSFGKAMQDAATDAIKAAGGKVVGSVRFPQNNPDFSSFILQAIASKAKVLWLISAAEDTTNALKQASEFDITQGGQKMIALLQEITDTHALGVKATQGLILTDAFYWDMNDETRAFSKRFLEKVGHMPTMIQAGLYSATMHYLKAIEAIGTDEAPKVMEQMRATPVNDFFARNGKIRIDGRMVHDMYLFEVKKPEESKGEWDLYKLIATVPGDEAFRPLDKGGCPLVKG